MKTVKAIKPVGRKKVYDISVKDAEHYFLENGVVTHNTGGIYSSDTIFIITRAQEKEDGELAGYKFTINIEKSRYVFEKSKFPFVVTKSKGINKFSGLLDIALDLGFVDNAKKGWYTRPSVENDKSWRRADTNAFSFWEPIFKEGKFGEAIYAKYGIGVVATDDQEDSSEADHDVELD